MKTYARVKENLSFGQSREWKEVKREGYCPSGARLYFADGSVGSTFAYEVITVVFKKK